MLCTKQKVLRRFWYATVPVEALGDRPVPFTLLGENIVMGLVGLFAIFHGHAHGTEMPLDASGGAYGAGFVLATALLHIAGIALGVAIGRIGDAYGRAAYRLGGAFVVLAGVALLTHAL